MRVVMGVEGLGMLSLVGDRVRCWSPWCWPCVYLVKITETPSDCGDDWSRSVVCWGGILAIIIVDGVVWQVLG